MVTYHAVSHPSWLIAKNTDSEKRKHTHSGYMPVFLPEMVKHNSVCLVLGCGIYYFGNNKIKTRFDI